MKTLRNIHPGEILLEEFLNQLHISDYRLAKNTFLPQPEYVRSSKEEGE